MQKKMSGENTRGYQGDTETKNMMHMWNVNGMTEKQA